MAASTRSVAGVSALFKPFSSPALNLKHRIVLAPLTRCRAPNNVPSKEAIEYYRQRATDGGLLISEGTVVSADGHGYPQTPGLYTDEQVEAWKLITEAVHAKGGVIFAQIWHVGRVSASAFQPDGGAPVSSSSIPAPSDSTAVDPRTFETIPLTPPRQLAKEELPKYRDYYVEAAKNAIRAGFDGVEVHGAHGYLLDVFLKDSANDRTDEYGGSIENRARFPLEVVRAVAEAVGPERTAVRFSPFSSFVGAKSSHPFAQFAYVLEELSPLGLAYVHLVEPRVNGVTKRIDSEIGNHSLLPFRRIYAGTLLAAGGLTPKLAQEAVENGCADLVAFGRTTIPNPDYVERIRLGAEFTPYDRAVFYAPPPGKGNGGGYIDYSPLSEEEHAKLEAKIAAVKV